MSLHYDNAPLKEAVRHLFNWQCYGGDNFHSILFHLITKGSFGYREKLGAGFPYELQAWRLWQESPNEWEFFKSFGFERPEVLSPRPGPYDKQRSQENDQAVN